MHKLTSLEAQRVTSVLSDTIDKLQTLSYVPVDPSGLELDSHTSALQEAGCNQVKTCMQSLWAMEENERRSKESSFGGGDNSFEFREQMYNSTKALCRILRKTPIAMDILMERGGNGSDMTVEFCRLLQDLVGITFRRISTTVEEEAANSQTLKDLRDKEKSLEKERMDLHQNLEFQVRPLAMASVCFCVALAAVCLFAACLFVCLFVCLLLFLLLADIIY